MGRRGLLRRRPNPKWRRLRGLLRPMSDGHNHTDDGGHAGHAHGVSADADTKALAITLGLIVGCMAVEVGVGV